MQHGIALEWNAPRVRAWENSSHFNVAAFFCRAQVDDDELEKQLEEWNLGKETEQQQQQGSVGMAAAAPGAAAAAPAVEPRMTRAQRRKSMLPAGGLGRPQLGEGGAPAALQREPSDEEKAAEARKVGRGLPAGLIVLENLLRWRLCPK